jgi:Domain of unknown function (DUF4145)
MPKQQHILPEYKLEAFTCPHCNFNAKQDWDRSYYFFQQLSVNLIESAKCQHCNKLSIWYLGARVYPDTILVDEPNIDMPEDIKLDYHEAAQILDKSPRASAALLRLGVQKLCEFLGKKGKIDSMIKELVKEGLPDSVQKALDIVRVVGNDAVHPGQLDLRDDTKIVMMLFKMINFICEKMISEPKYINEHFGNLPIQKLEAIKLRDLTN